MVERTAQVPNPAAPPVEMFPYPPVPAPALPSFEAFASIAGADGILNSGQPAARGQAVEEPEEKKSAASQARRANELRENFEQGRARGFGEGRAAEREAQAAAIEAREAARAEQCVRLLEQFHAERDRYFEAVEPQVVRLALAVAARILRREAQMDPLLLSGAVRVALGQLSASTEVRLRAPSADLELWADAIAHLPNLAPRPVVVAGENMRLGECVLETELGKVDLGITPQLAEIERGFFDRAGPNPPVEMPTTIREDMEE